MKNIPIVFALCLFLYSSIYGQNKVGIGLINPSAKLHIHESNFISGPGASIKLSDFFTGVSATDGLSMFINNSTSGIISYENLPFKISTNNTDRISILNDGRIGINTNTLLGFSDLTLKSLNATGLGGMFVESPSASNGLPFYGYATNGQSKAFHYYNSFNDNWILNVGGDVLFADNDQIWIG
ncbi:MAG: hypothetical protein AAGK97_08440, partial [Bacteroidota bacterium]